VGAAVQAMVKGVRLDEPTAPWTSLQMKYTPLIFREEGQSGCSLVYLGIGLGNVSTGHEKKQSCMPQSVTAYSFSQFGNLLAAKSG
jgi:hypothetical protein